MKHDYGDASRAYSYEYSSYYASLLEMGHEVILFDFMGELRQHGKNEMNQMLIEVAAKLKPQVTIFHLYTDQFLTETISALKKHTTTLSIFHDDTWRKEYFLQWAPLFDFSTTPDTFSLRKYKTLGMRNVLLFPYGCSQARYKKLNLQKEIDVSFVGRWHPYRQWLIKRLEKAGIKVKAFGPGWQGGMIDHDEMIRVFNQSKINLNLSNSASWDIRYLISSPRAILDRVRSKKNVEQLKARHFEINSCGGFQLSYYVTGLEQHYLIGDEIAVYDDADDLIEKALFYLKNEDVRDTIADSGYRRTVADHAFKKRFAEIFSAMGLNND
jgi:spore maturation protein CgeB